MSVREMTYTIPAVAIEAATEHNDKGAALAFFLLENTGSIYGRWVGRMKAADQRSLFGKNIGKGRLWIDGDTEEVAMTVSVCFGTDRDTAFFAYWRQL